MVSIAPDCAGAGTSDTKKTGPKMGLEGMSDKEPES